MASVVQPIKVAITGAAGQIGGFLTHMVAQGAMFGPDQPVTLALIELPVAEQALAGHVLELRDGAYPCLAALEPTVSPAEGFAGADFVILVGARPRGPGMERADLLKANAAIFQEQGRLLNEHAKPTTKVIVVGNPANTNALICSRAAPNIPARNFSALTRLDQNRSVGMIAEKKGCKVTDVKNFVVWGNHSKTQFPDTFSARIADVPLRDSLSDQHEWLDSDFITRVQNRGGEIIAAMGKSSSASAANAVCDHVRDLFNGTQEGNFVSMAVVSDGNSYGVPEGLVYSFPVTISNQEWTIVPELPINDFMRQKIDASAAELIEERTMAFE